MNCIIIVMYIIIHDYIRIIFYAESTLRILVFICLKRGGRVKKKK